MNKAAKTYLWQFLSAMALYVVILLVSVNLLRTMEASSPWRFAAAILPMIPIFLGLLAFLRFFVEMDELQKRIQLYAFAFSFGATGLLTFSYGLLEIAGLPHISFVFIFPLMIALWGVGTFIATRRYQ